MPVVRRIFSRILISLLFLILLINLYFPVTTRLTGKAHPSLFGYRQAIILTGSMEPAIQAGDLVVFQEKTSYGQGEVILFEEGHHLVTHRITKSFSDHWITQGDANNTPDAPITPDQVLGSMVFRLPQIGRLAWFFKSPAGLAALGALLIAVCCQPWRGSATAQVDQRVDAMGDEAIDR